MAAQPLENLKSLLNHHIPNMSVEHQRVLLLNAEGKTPAEIAAIENVSEGTVKHRLSVASVEIARCRPSQTLAPGMRSFWVACHSACCLKEQAKLGGLVA
jgi:hypothetical protein